MYVNVAYVWFEKIYILSLGQLENNKIVHQLNVIILTKAVSCGFSCKLSDV